MSRAFATRLRARRLGLGLSQITLARRLVKMEGGSAGSWQSRISEYESGKENAEPQTQAALMRALSVRPMLSRSQEVELVKLARMLEAARVRMLALRAKAETKPSQPAKLVAIGVTIASIANRALAIARSAS